MASLNVSVVNPNVEPDQSVTAVLPVVVAAVVVATPIDPAPPINDGNDTNRPSQLLSNEKEEVGRPSCQQHSHHNSYRCDDQNDKNKNQCTGNSIQPPLVGYRYPYEENDPFLSSQQDVRALVTPLLVLQYIF
jgi:hypothetical protein